jgi:hypothetical protein
MSKAHALPTGLGIEDEGLELPLDELPEWEDSKVKVFPMVRATRSSTRRIQSPCQRLLAPIASGDADTQQCWKNPVTGALHIQVHPCGAQALHIDPLPAGASRDGALFPDGADITDLKETRALLYKIQRPGIAPEVSDSILVHPASQLCTHLTPR